MRLFQRKKTTPDILKEIYKKARVKRYIQLALGSFLIAVAFNVFLMPNDIVSGGVSGVAIITKHFFGLDPSIFIFITSILLLILSYFTLGKKQTFDSILGSLLFPLFVICSA